MGLLKRGLTLIAGVANEKSICWPIAEQAAAEGAVVMLSYHPSMEKRVLPLAARIGATACSCDFTDNEQIQALFGKIKGLETPLRYAVHVIAFSDGGELRGDFLDVSDENFINTMRISCGSFITMARECAKLMRANEEVGGEKGSLIGLTYAASHRPHPHYNIMSVAKAALESAMMNAAFQLGKEKIRVNMLSPSPEDTLSARGVKDFRDIGKWAEGMSMLGRRVTLEEIAKTAVFLLSDWASGITGQTIMVDGGASVSGMPPLTYSRTMGEGRLAIADESGRKPRSLTETTAEGAVRRMRAPQPAPPMQGEYLTNAADAVET
jgi:enoyl-[acyl-carrier protein] reductase I